MPDAALLDTQTRAVVEYDPLLDKSYQHTAIGSDVAAFIAWFELGGASPRSVDQYERDLARGAKLYPLTPLEQWTGDMLLHVAKQFKPAERRTRMAPYRTFFKWARKSRRIMYVPTEELPIFKRPQQKFIDTFSDEEIALLCDLPIRDGALMQILFDAGLRKAEARRFRLMHLRTSPPPGEVVILKGKGGKDRVIPATLAASQRVNELAVLEGLSPKDYLWWTRPGGGSGVSRTREMGDGSFDRWWRRCLDDADVRYRNPHVARHTFATRWLRRGGRITTLSTAMGHTSLATTYDLYGHLDTRDLIADLALVESHRSESAD